MSKTNLKQRTQIELAQATVQRARSGATLVHIQQAHQLDLQRENELIAKIAKMEAEEAEAKESE